MPNLLQHSVGRSRKHIGRVPEVFGRRLTVEQLESRKLLTGFTGIGLDAGDLASGANVFGPARLGNGSLAQATEEHGTSPLFSDPQAGASVFHRMFVTGNFHAVTSGGFLGPNARNYADFECTFAAWDAGWLPGWDGQQIEYTAFLSHSGLANPNATDRINLQGPVYNTRRELVWADPSNYINEEPANSWGYTEYGDDVSSSKLWSGSDGGGGVENDCGGWTNPLAAGTHGLLEGLTFGGTPSGCQGGGHFICIGPAEPGEFATVTDSFVYHKNSVFDTGDISLALDTSKSLVRENNTPESLGLENLINSSRGINGIVFDFDNLPGTLTNNDFVFQWSPMGAFVVQDNLPVNWLPAAAPTGISTLFEATRDRVVINWQDNTIVNRWLRITILANENTGLLQDDVYYIGHLLGETTGPAGGTFTVAFADITSIRSEVGQNANSGSIHDVDKSGTVSFADISAMRSNIGAQLTHFAIPASGGGGTGGLMSSPLPGDEKLKPDRVAEEVRVHRNDMSQALITVFPGIRNQTILDIRDRWFENLSAREERRPRIDAAKARHSQNTEFGLDFGFEELSW